MSLMLCVCDDFCLETAEENIYKMHELSKKLDIEVCWEAMPGNHIIVSPNCDCKKIIEYMYSRHKDLFKTLKKYNKIVDFC